MSGQETIRVLEVEVDTALSSAGAAESGGDEGGAGQSLEATEEAQLEGPVTTSSTTAGKTDQMN